MYVTLHTACWSLLFSITTSMLIPETISTILNQSQSIVPQVSVKNGSLGGLYLPAFDEDVFLGVPFAAPPIGNLRLRRPAPYPNSWKTIRDAKIRAPSCPGYAGFDVGLTIGEDCLTLDVIRPAGTTEIDLLPVFVWIYGGGFDAGGSADPKYNTSYLVNASVAIGKPIIAVAINYRVGGWGFLASRETVAAGETNIGLWDQRMALRWIQENIHAFGGDHTKVTIAGESAGAFSVGYHLLADDGNDSGLFRAAMMQSGTALGPTVNTISQLNSTYQPIYENITSTVGCINTTDTLNCLRKANYATLFDAFKPFVMTPIVDGSFLMRLPSESFAKGFVADVAILAGSNTDEGTASFWGPRGTLNNDGDVEAFLGNIGVGLPNTITSQIMDLYPDDPASGCPFGTGEERFAENGFQYKRGAAIVGDNIIHAGRRATTEYFSARPEWKKKPVFSYRFDQTPWNGVEELIATVAPVFVTHYSEICFVFNLSPSASVNNTNWIGPYKEFYDLSNLMSRSWISFVHDLNPNAHGYSTAPVWPEYSQSKRNMVFRVNGTEVEKDEWRIGQLKFWQSIWSLVKT